MTQGSLRFKAVSGTLDVDEAEGIVECFVAAIGNKDSVGDIVMPGAFTNSLKRRAPRVVWGHDWNQPIGKVLSIYEVGPGDPRLPGKMRQAGVGGLFAKVQFNLKSERGREAFASVAFFGQDQEWSIGYKTVDAIYDNSKQANLLKEVELYEVSPVLHGANQLTGTVSVKADDVAGVNQVVSGSVDMASALAQEIGRPIHIMFMSEDTVVYGVTGPDNDTQTFEANYKRTNDGFQFGDHKPVKFVVNGSATPAPQTSPKKPSPDDEAGDEEPSTREDIDTAHLFQTLHALIAHLEEQTSRGQTDEYVDAEAAPSIKAQTPPLNPANLAPDTLPQERVTGDVLRGYGPRRGNLERLLRYWRPIMRREGGFRRCLVILADHPELYPLENLCSWLHHETTGLWPNEGCHHPGMKNCRRKLRGVVHGSLWNDREFDRHLGDMSIPSARRLNALPGKALPIGVDVNGDNEIDAIITFDDMRHAFTVLKEFIDAEPEFMQYLGDGNNWEHEGDFEDPNTSMIMPMMHPRMMDEDHDGGCGCGGRCGGMAKSDCGCDSKDDEFAAMAKAAAIASSLEFKAGRTLSGRNTQRLQQAATLIQEVLSSGDVQGKDDHDYVVVDVTPETMFEVKGLLDPVLDYYDATAILDEANGEFILISVKSDDQFLAMKNLVPLHEPTPVQTKSLEDQLQIGTSSHTTTHLDLSRRNFIEEKAAAFGNVISADFSPKYQTWVIAVEGDDGQRWDTFWSDSGELQATNRICGLTLDAEAL